MKTKKIKVTITQTSKNGNIVLSVYNKKVIHIPEAWYPQELQIGDIVELHIRLSPDIFVHSIRVNKTDLPCKCKQY